MSSFAIGSQPFLEYQQMHLSSNDNNLVIAKVADLSEPMAAASMLGTGTPLVVPAVARLKLEDMSSLS